MIIKMLTILLSLTLDFLAIIGVTEGDKDLENCPVKAPGWYHLAPTGAHPATQGEDDTADHRSGKNGIGDPHGQIQESENGRSSASQSGNHDLQARDGAALAPRTGSAQVDLQTEEAARSAWHIS
jgi:hypothetical protein